MLDHILMISERNKKDVKVGVCASSVAVDRHGHREHLAALPPAAAAFHRRSVDVVGAQASLELP